MTTLQNQLIGLMPARSRAQLLALTQEVQLTLSDILCEAGDRMRYVYFPLDSFISLVAKAGDSPGIEVGMIGAEGMLGASLALGVAANPLRAVVQGPGLALRLSARDFCAELDRNPSLTRAVKRYLYVLMRQQSTSAVCLRFHAIGPRLARWLLMSEDRAHAARFHVTHEFLAYMLGVRRAGITNAATALQRLKLIDYHRGEMRVLDRKGLETAACECYSADCRIYAQLLA